MSTYKFNIEHGLKIGDQTLHDVVMKDHLTAEDLFLASEAAEKLVFSGEGDDAKPELVISPSLVSAETLRRQIKRIGDIEGPISMKVLGKLHEDDLAKINKMSQRIEAIKVSKAVARRGRSNTDATGN